MKTLSFIDISNCFNNSNWRIENIENCKLRKEEEDYISLFVIEKLNSKDSNKRYIASHIIAEFKIDSAKDKLIERILDPQTLNSNGTMSYALEQLNCINRLVQVFTILATQSYESKCHAFNILRDQIFEFTIEDINKMKSILKEAKINKDKNQIFDSETLEMVQNGYEGFAKYLED